jgi:hypothetical protein
VAVAFALKAWSCLCLFPVHAWNDVRLRPSFLISEGIPLYPGLKEGLITTWMYGPVAPLLFSPLSLSRDPDVIFVAAGMANILLLALPLAAACLFWKPEAPLAIRLQCTFITLLLLPVDLLKFLTADNASLAFGLLSISCFTAGMRRQQGRGLLVCAAIAGVTSAFAKPHGVAVPAGELLWLAFNRRPKEAVLYAAAAVAGIVAWAVIGFSLSSSPRAFWQHVIVLPARLPWHPDVAAHAKALMLPLLVAVALPAFGVAALLYRGAARTPLGAALFIWLVALPISLAATFKYGGNVNSLHPVFYLIPFALLEWMAAREGTSRARTFVFSILMLGLSTLTFIKTYGRPMTPLLQPCYEARDFASRNPDSLWLPWRPLATFLATGQHHHDEDGLHVRQISGLYPSRAHAYEALPADWKHTAIEIPGMSWSLTEVMQPGPLTEERHGLWIVYSTSGASPSLGTTHR